MGTAVETMTILGTTWRATRPDVRIRRNAEPIRTEPLLGLRLQYRATATRICLGHHRLRGPGAGDVACMRQPEPGSRRCRSCAIHEATFAANLHRSHLRGTGELDPSIVEHLQQTNLLYLAGFADGSIKVGTTTERRTDQRLAEQGAWQAALVAEAADGIAVREVEDLVTAELGIVQSVSIRRKLDGLVDRPVDDDGLRAELGRLRHEVHELLKRLADPNLRAIDRAWTHPRHDGPVWQHVRHYPYRLDDGVHDVDVVDACGRVVALRRCVPGADDVFVADLGELYGVVVEPGDHGSRPFVLQDSLF